MEQPKLLAGTPLQEKSPERKPSPATFPLTILVQVSRYRYVVATYVDTCNHQYCKPAGEHMKYVLYNAIKGPTHFQDALFGYYVWQQGKKEEHT